MLSTWKRNWGYYTTSAAEAWAIAKDSELRYRQLYLLIFGFYLGSTGKEYPYHLKLKHRLMSKWILLRAFLYVWQQPLIMWFKVNRPSVWLAYFKFRLENRSK